MRIATRLWLLAPIAIFLVAAPAGAVATPGQKCAAAKVRASGKKALKKLKCHATAIMRDDPVDPACLARAEQKFVEAFAKAELEGGCATTGDAAALEAMVDVFVGDVVAALPAAPAVSFAADVQPILTANCAAIGCHTGAFPAGLLNLTAGVAYGNLVAMDSLECPPTDRVAPGDPDASYLVHKLEGAGPCFMGTQMPQGQPPLPAAQIQLIRDWITQGAPNN